jgi:hypothetical protein
VIAGPCSSGAPPSLTWGKAWCSAAANKS